jgi:uridine kinase
MTVPSDSATVKRKRKIKRIAQTETTAPDSPVRSWVAAILGPRATGLYAITGPAGAGKTFVSSALAQSGDFAVYSADFRFISDSYERQALLDRKADRSANDYRDSVNQYNWWDWAAIERDLAVLLSGTPVKLAQAYERSTGQRSATHTISPARSVILEGAILGPPPLVSRINRIIFLCTPPEVRFFRILEKDRHRRGFDEILARFLITEYSETIYYRNLFSWARDKVVFVDAASGEPTRPPVLSSRLFLPMPMTP